MSDTCHSCGRAIATRFARVEDPQTRETFQIAWCDACALGQTSPEPADLGKYYGAVYHGNRHGFTALARAWQRARLTSAVAGPPARLLDVGCGDGTFMLAMQKRGWQVVGTELDARIARDAGLDVRESIDEIQDKFACVTLWHSLEHMRDPRATLAAASARLADGGTLVVAVPNADSLQARAFGARWFHLDVPRHLFHFSERALVAMLGELGLAPVKKWRLELELDLFGWAQSALNAILPTPNVFFQRLTGKPVTAGGAEIAASFVLGPALCALAIPATAAGAVTGRSATLVLAARRA